MYVEVERTASARQQPITHSHRWFATALLHVRGRTSEGVLIAVIRERQLLALSAGPKKSRRMLHTLSFN